MGIGGSGSRNGEAAKFVLGVMGAPTRPKPENPLSELELGPDWWPWSLGMPYNPLVLTLLLGPALVATTACTAGPGVAAVASVTAGAATGTPNEGAWPNIPKDAPLPANICWMAN